MRMSAGRRPKVAVVLNRNARGVRGEVIEQLGRIVPQNDLYVSTSVEESRAIARTLVERSYEGVLFGGGDGTFVRCLSDLTAESTRRARPLPSVGVLRLGSGNALADAVGASTANADGFVRDLRRARSASTTRRTLSLLEVEGTQTPFAGLGLDAQILDDFGRMGRLAERATATLGRRRKLSAATQYALAVGAFSVPRFLFGELPEVEVVATGGAALRIDWRSGRTLEERPLEEGTVLFRGRAALCTASTIPYFGLKMKMFPYADRLPGHFQLRVATSSTVEILANLPAIFRGEYRSPTVHDFLCRGVELRVARPVPVQIGGDLQEGLRDHLRIDLSTHPVPLAY